MAGKCKYCGFVGTQDEIVDHAGEMCQGDCQPDIMVKNLTDNQQRFNAIADALCCLHDGDNQSNDQWFMKQIAVIRQLQ